MSLHAHSAPRRTRWPRTLIALGGLLLSGCWGGLSEEPPEPLEDPPPAPLVELLYAGEYGPEAAGLGDEVRATLWLRRMALSPGQLRAWRGASVRLRADEVALREQLTALDAAQAERLAPIYAELRGALAAGVPDEDQLADWAARLAAARAHGVDPRRLLQEQAEAVLAVAETLLDGLDASRRDRVSEALFFLRRAAGPDTRPAAWDALLGQPWPAGDFATLRRSVSPQGASAIDISALWTLDDGETLTTDGIDASGRLAILALALLHPALAVACDAIGAAPPPGDPP